MTTYIYIYICGMCTMFRSGVTFTFLVELVLTGYREIAETYVCTYELQFS